MQLLHIAILGSILYVTPGFVDDNSSARNSINKVQGKQPLIIIYHFKLSWLLVLSRWCRIYIELDKVGLWFRLSGNYLGCLNLKIVNHYVIWQGFHHADEE